jgi:steroid delta-isomerase-like uncharacterized protein
MQHLETVKAWIEAMNAHDVEKMFSFCSDELIGLEVAESKPNVGKKAVADSYRDLFSGFPDCKCEILNAFAGAAQVLAEVQWTGKNTGPFRGEPATNKPLDVRIAYIFKFKENLINQITEYYDGAAVAAQMES